MCETTLRVLSVSFGSVILQAWIAKLVQSSTTNTWHLLENKYDSHPPEIELWFDLRYDKHEPQPTGVCIWSMETDTGKCICACVRDFGACANACADPESFIRGGPTLRFLCVF